MRVKVTGFLDLDDKYADPDHQSGVSAEGWESLVDKGEANVSDLEDLEIKSV